MVEEPFFQFTDSFGGPKRRCGERQRLPGRQRFIGAIVNCMLPPP